MRSPWAARNAWSPVFFENLKTGTLWRYMQGNAVIPQWYVRCKLGVKITLPSIAYTIHDNLP